MYSVILRYVEGGGKTVSGCYGPYHTMLVNSIAHDYFGVRPQENGFVVKDGFVVGEIVGLANLSPADFLNGSEITPSEDEHGTYLTDLDGESPSLIGTYEPLMREYGPDIENNVLRVRDGGQVYKVEYKDGIWHGVG